MTAEDIQSNKNRSRWPFLSVTRSQARTPPEAVRKNSVASGTWLWLSEEGGPAQQMGRVSGCGQDPRGAPKERGTGGALQPTVPGWPDGTLKLGWRDTGGGAAFQEGRSLGAGEGRVVHQRRVGDAAVQGSAAHCPVPVPGGACEQDFPLGTENVPLSWSHQKPPTGHFGRLTLMVSQ